MALASINQLANNTTADALAVDANFNALAAQVNGNLDSTNMQSGGLASAAIANAAITAAKMSLPITTTSNTGSGGGTMYSTTIGTIKLCWGTTNTQTIGGAAPQTANLSVNFPASFFTTIQAAITSAGPPGTNSQYYWTNVSGITTATMNVNFNQSVGTAVVFNAQFFVIGT